MSTSLPQRLSQQGLVTLLFITALFVAIPSLVLVVQLTNSPAEDALELSIDSLGRRRDDPIEPSDPKEETTSLVRQVNANEPSNKKSLPNHFKSYPGFTTEASVVCGGHKAPSCDQCPQGHGASWCNGECEWRGGTCARSSKLEHIHPDYFRITERYAFQPVMNQNHEFVNVILVRSAFRDSDDEDLYNFYKDDILFLGISSFESYPLKSPNPYSGKYESEYYLNMFPGFLHMMRDPDAHFPTDVKSILMSQSDFMLDDPMRFGRRHANDEKIYDFVYSGGDQDVEKDCVGWVSLM